MDQYSTVGPESQAQFYTVLTKRAEIKLAIDTLDPERVHALDFETTSLDPSDGLVRLTTIAGHGHAFIIDHFDEMPFKELAPILAKRAWAVFYAGFEGKWIDYYADDLVELYDVQHMRKAKMGGGPSSLKIMALKDLKIEMDKEEQNSNWERKELTKKQLDYAMFDGIVTFQLWEHWKRELTDPQWNGFLVINEAWRGTLEMEETGLILDVEHHRKLVVNWLLKRDTAFRYLRRWTPEHVIANLNSNKQISDFLKAELHPKVVAAWPKTGKRGDLQVDRTALRHAAHRLPYPFNRWLAALMVLNYYNKYLGTYGQKLIDKQEKFGKITTRFNMAAAVTGRYSSSSENLQNIPRKYSVRRSFTTLSVIRPTSGTDPIRMVMADYSSIEVRVLAELSGDDKLLWDAIYGDVHSRSAAQIFNIEYSYFQEVINSKGLAPNFANVYPAFKSLRSRAKAFTFQLLYGAGAAALAIVLRCTDEEAFAAIDAWATVYPKAYHYRTLMYEKMKFDGFLPVVDGRTIFVHRLDRTMPVAANYPVQGAAASVMYRAVYHVHKRLYDSGIACRMAASVHDELIMYARNSVAPRSKAILADGMAEGWLDIFPHTSTENLLEAVVGDFWSDKI